MASTAKPTEQSKDVIDGTVTAEATVVNPGQSVDEALVQSAGFDDAVSGAGAGDTSVALIDDTPSTGAVVYSQQAEFDRNEVSMPRLRLAQGLTQEVQDGTARPGDWVLLGQEAAAEVTIIPIMFGRERVRVDDPRADRPNILCSSPDAVRGVGNPGVDCARCPFAQWQDNPSTGKREKPACGLIYHYLSYVVKYGEVVDLQLKGTGTTAARYVNTMINTRGLGKFAIQLGSKSEKGPRGPYYVPTAKLAQVSAEDFELAQEFASSGV